MYIYGIGGLIMFIWFCSAFYKVRKTSEANENNIASLRTQLSDMKRRLDKFESETATVRAEYVGNKVKEENDIDRQNKERIAKDLRKKYDAHVSSVSAMIGAGRCSKSDLRAAILEPKDWIENIAATPEKRLAMFAYYEDVFRMIISSKKLEEIALDVYEEAYRLIGFIGDELKGESVEIMSWYCDWEQKTYGKSAKLTAMCNKLDVIGVLDRGVPFGGRLK